MFSLIIIRPKDVYKNKDKFSFLIMLTLEEYNSFILMFIEYR
jgi:hypothetical protein